MFSVLRENALGPRNLAQLKFLSQRQESKHAIEPQDLRFEKFNENNGPVNC